MKTYGTLSRTSDKWVLEAEPHVVIRAKRVFTRLAKLHRGRLHLSDTLDTCRDLAWFLERYPVSMSDTDRTHLEGRAAAHFERETLVARLLSGMTEPRAFDLALPPRDYQRVAGEMVLRTGGLLLADELGTGKTVSAICMLSDPRARPALVVTMTHLTKQWEREIHRFLPGVSTHVLKSGQPYDLTKGRRTKPGQSTLPGIQTFPDVIITNYHKLAGWPETLAPLLKSVTFDEVQELRRGSDSQKGQAAYTIASKCDFRLGLSATPIYNLGSEIYAVMQALQPEALGTRSEFLAEWCGSTDSRGNAKLGDARAFGTYMRDSGLMLRRTREDVGREIPEVVRIPHEVDTDAAPLEDITSAAEQLASVIVDAQRGWDRVQAGRDLDVMVRHATGVAKAPYVAEFVRLLLESGEPVVLFGWHHDVYSVWKERLEAYRPAVYTGQESPAAKEEARERFVSGQTPLLIMSLRSGAGLDGLQERCRTVVFGELDWSPGVHEQCIGRIHRDGQAARVLAYYLIANEGSDPVIADILQVKRAQVEGIRNPTADIIEQLDVSGDRIRELAQAYLRKQRPERRQMQLEASA